MNHPLKQICFPRLFVAGLSLCLVVSACGRSDSSNNDDEGPKCVVDFGTTIQPSSGPQNGTTGEKIYTFTKAIASDCDSFWAASGNTQVSITVQGTAGELRSVGIVSTSLAPTKQELVLDGAGRQIQTSLDLTKSAVDWDRPLNPHPTETSLKVAFPANYVTGQITSIRISFLGRP